ncbi:uncharacterized protein N7498_009453 [Penicillium cinerascens]|uniref:NADH dehydrogenase [ubiquinone] 1 alpha subcomplex subunit n=1 Tax=Penicillium cinerascens TaxID=70096 RepID=A0A9W9J4G9_9EURO|nr:uncharacterized protein N7498_009453 [Penicillium cinerascens]KAJ5190468.1 hypothetical protein N7498_009453 [Penicillium cinerascens]
MVNSLWFKWKSLRLPWRKMYIVGQDLAGNTFWVFKDVANANRLRRIVKFDPRAHFDEVQVTPQWHQWLRYLRENPPTIEEQRQDLMRQANMKNLARLADERWASKPSFLDKPPTQQPKPTPQNSQATESTKPDNATSTQNASSPAEPTPQPEPVPETKPKKPENPWDKAVNPGDDWQPESWTPKSHR